MNRQTANVTHPEKTDELQPEKSRELRYQVIRIDRRCKGQYATSETELNSHMRIGGEEDGCEVSRTCTGNL